MAQNADIKIKIKYSPATTQNLENSDPPKVFASPNVVVKPRSNRRPFKGHGWSGSKKQRRLIRENKTKAKKNTMLFILEGRLAFTRRGLSVKPM